MYKLKQSINAIPRIILIIFLVFAVLICPIVILIKIGILTSELINSCDSANLDYSNYCFFANFLKLPGAFMDESSSSIVCFLSHLINTRYLFLPILFGLLILCVFLFIISSVVHLIVNNRKNWFKGGWILHYFMVIVALAVIQLFVALLFSLFAIHAQNLTKVSLVEIYSNLRYYGKPNIDVNVVTVSEKNLHYQYPNQVGDYHYDDNLYIRLPDLKCCGIDNYTEFMSNEILNNPKLIVTSTTIEFPYSCCVQIQNGNKDDTNSNSRNTGCNLTSDQLESPKDHIYTDPCFPKINESLEAFGKIGNLGFEFVVYQLIILQVIVVFWVLYKLFNGLLGLTRRRRQRYVTVQTLVD